MKCKTCCFFIILDPTRDSRYVCVRNPPVLNKDEYGKHRTAFPAPSPKWWCGEWKPIGFIKMWPDNLTKDFK